MRMTKKLLVALVIACCWWGVAADEAAETPITISPLLVGSQIPDISLTMPDGKVVKLREEVAKQPTVLIFYRGSW